jgi:hypothetical protein
MCVCVVCLIKYRVIFNLRYNFSSAPFSFNEYLITDVRNVRRHVHMPCLYVNYP